jgi:hypothetical protein
MPAFVSPKSSLKVSQDAHSKIHPFSLQTDLHSGRKKWSTKLHLSHHAITNEATRNARQKITKTNLNPSNFGHAILHPI